MGRGEVSFLCELTTEPPHDPVPRPRLSCGGGTPGVLQRAVSHGNRRGVLVSGYVDGRHGRSAIVLHLRALFMKMWEECGK